MNHEEKCGDSKKDGESLKALDELANPPGFSEDYLMAEAVDETMYVSGPFLRIGTFVEYCKVSCISP